MMLVVVCMAAEASKVPQPTGHPLRKMMTTTQAAPTDLDAIEAALKIPTTACTKTVGQTACPMGQVQGCCDAEDCGAIEDYSKIFAPALLKAACEMPTSYYACCTRPAATGRK